VGTDRGGGWFDGATWEDVLPPPLALEDVTFDHQGQAWLADGRGVDVYDEGTLTTYGYDEGLSSIQTEALLVDSQGRVWVATETGGHGCIGGEGAAGINLFEEGEWTWVDTSDLFGPTILDLAEDASGDIWAVGDGGIARFDGAAWETMLLPAEEATQVVNCVAVDAANRVWFGAKQIGLWVWGGEEWTQYTTADGLAGETVWAIAFDAAGRTWAGTNGGLSVLEGESWISYTTDDGLAHNEVRALLITGDGVWVGTFRGLSHVVFDTGS
jgi:ligand-binding sensor domain-containing protein